MANLPVDEVVVEEEVPTISSFTVNPAKLFLSSSGTYDMYVDEQENLESVIGDELDTGNEFVFDLGSDSDDLEENEDYVGIEE